MWDPALRTPGIVSSSRLTRVGDSDHLLCDGPGLGEPVHQEVAFLEGWQQRLPEERQHDEAEHHGETHRRVRRGEVG